MRTKTPHRLVPPRALVRRRLAGLTSQWPLALAGRVRGVHQARVASRRLRELLPVLASPPRDAAFKKLRRDLRDLTRALGPVRELDVALATLADVQRRAAAARAQACAVVRTRLEAERQTAAGRLGGLQRIDLAALAGRLYGLAPDRPSDPHLRRTAGRVAARIDRRSRALGEAVDRCGTLFSVQQLHAARIALKKFRYALEIGEQMGRFRLKATTARLKGLQDLLGHLHDRHVLAVRIRDCAATDPDCRAALEEVARGIDEDMRRLHCAFLAERHHLARVFLTARRVRVRLEVLSVPLEQAPAGAGTSPAAEVAG